MHIRPLTPADACAYREIRFAGLRECPTAFASSYDEEVALPLSAFEARLAVAPDRGVFGAFEGSSLTGVVGLGREGMAKLAHKAFVWGMYVAPASRGAGTGRALLLAALAFARSVPGTRQVHLRVNVANAGAIALYESVGFRAFGREPGAMLVEGELHDELHMCVCLQRSAEISPPQ